LTFTDDDVRALADGLRDAASTDDLPQSTPAEAWQNVTRYAFDRAEIELSSDQFERAWRKAWQRAFMGGNYTLDARAILTAALAPDGQEAGR
jgi:hypothetical protein